MKQYNVIQGTQEWHALRATKHGASNASAMMGVSNYLTRDELLYQKKTGETKEIPLFLQILFDQGNEAENSMRPVIEKLIGEELFPVTGVSDNLLASFDGLTLLEDTIFEHKLWNEKLVEQVRNKQLSPHYYWQLEQQLLVSGAEKCIFVTSDGTPNKMEWMWYERVGGRESRLIRGWDQFDEDLKNYSPPIAEKPKPQAEVIEQLPALFIQLTGEVTESNLPQYRERALSFIESINTDLQTDEDFSNAEEAIKFCKSAEDKIKLVKQQALSQTRSIDELFSTLDQIGEKLRRTRLNLDKQAEAEKKNRKNEMANQAEEEFIQCLKQANTEFSPIVIRGITANFSGAIKGKRLLSSMRSAINDESAKVKIALNEKRDKIRKNVEVIANAGKEYKCLFFDTQALIEYEHSHLELIVKNRVDEFKAAEKQKAEKLEKQKSEEKQLIEPLPEIPKAEFTTDATHPGSPREIEFTQALAPELGPDITTNALDQGLIKIVLNRTDPNSRLAFHCIENVNGNEILIGTEKIRVDGLVEIVITRADTKALATNIMTKITMKMVERNNEDILHMAGKRAIFRDV